MSEKNSFIFYRSFHEALKLLPTSEEKALIYEAVVEYALNQVEIELSGTCKGMFLLIKPQLDANQKRFQNGNLGGRPKSNHNLDETKDNQKITKPEPNKNANANLNVNVNANKKVCKYNRAEKLIYADFTEEEKQYFRINTPDVDIGSLIEDFKLGTAAKNYGYSNFYAALQNWARQRQKSSNVSRLDYKGRSLSHKEKGAL